MRSPGLGRHPAIDRSHATPIPSSPFHVKHTPVCDTRVSDPPRDNVLKPHTWGLASGSGEAPTSRDRIPCDPE